MEIKSPEDKVLDEIFNSFRAEPIAFEAEEALAFAKKKKGNGVLTYNNAWFKLMVALIVSPVLLVLIWKANVVEKEGGPFVKSSKKHHSAKLLSDSLSSENKVVSGVPLSKPTNKQHPTSLGQPENRTKLFGSINLTHWPVFTEVSTEFEALVLSIDELNKLHIYTDYCELYYTSLKDSIFIHRNMLSKAPLSCFFYLHIDKPGGGYTNTCHARFKESQLDSLAQFLLPAYPMLIEQRIDAVENKRGKDVKVGDKRQFLLDYQVTVTNEDVYLKYFKELLVPVEIKLIGKANIYGKTDQTVTFWYKPNEYFLNALSDANQAIVKSSFAHFKEETYRQRLLHFNDSVNRSTDLLKIDPTLFDSLIKQALILDKKQLKALGIRVRSNKFIYKHKGANNTLKLYIGENTTYVNTHGNDGSSTEKSTGRAMFYSGENISSLILLDKSILSQQLTRTYWNEKEQLFRSHFANLVPIKISIRGKKGKQRNEYLWFRRDFML